MGPGILTALFAAVMLAACSGSGTSSQSPERPPVSGGPDSAGSTGQTQPRKRVGDLELSAEQVSRLGVATSAAQAASYAPESEGFGVVINHDFIAQAVAEVQAATAAARLSASSLARARELAGGPGALGQDALEGAQRQDAADRSALQLAHRRLTSVLGVAFPWRGRPSGELDRLADGTDKLVRVTFAPGAGGSGTPRLLQVASLDSRAQRKFWTAHTIWGAPQDPALPGRSFFAVLEATDLAEGARVQAQSADDPATPGVVVPEAAVVISGEQSWCYVRRKDGGFRRTAIDTTRPFGAGYFVSDGIAAGDELVTAAAGLLLARELNSSTEAGD